MNGIAFKFFKCKFKCNSPQVHTQDTVPETLKLEKQLQQRHRRSENQTTKTQYAETEVIGPMRQRAFMFKGIPGSSGTNPSSVLVTDGDHRA